VFDIDAIADRSSDLPHMLPRAADFAAAVAALGVAAGNHVVVYDTNGLFSAARVWWMFRVFGHEQVSVLDGGLPAWQAIGGALVSEQTPSVSASTAITAVLDRDRVADRHDVEVCLGDAKTHVLDARSADRFEGLAPEPRAGLRGGHMPGAKSLPFNTLLKVGAGGGMRLKSIAELRDLFAGYGIAPGDPIITSCGSGVTAAVITLALEVAGFAPGRLYDGSWTEWGSRDDTAIATATPSALT